MTDARELLREIQQEQARDPHSEDVSEAAIYARTSSASQEFGYSIEEQVRQCWDRCEMFDWDVSYVFRDEAESGKNAERPMFQKMLSQAKNGHFDVLVFWKLDRFSRSIMHAVRLESKFRDWDVALHSATEQIDTTTPAGRFNFRNIANAAEFERDSIKQRTKMGHLARALDHKWPNATPPLGYTIAEDSRLKILGDEADLVRSIFEWYLHHRSMPEVALKLNNSDCKTKRGKEWGPRNVGTILRNRIYIGEYNVGEVEEYVGEYEIVDPGLFSQVSKIRNRFQTDTDAARPNMDPSRKQDKINEMFQQYSRYIRVARE